MKKLPVVSIEEDLRTLIEDAEDAQRNFDDDQFNLDRAIKDIKRSQDNRDFTKYRLEQFKQKHKLK